MVAGALITGQLEPKPIGESDGVLEKGGEVWQAVHSGLIKASDVRAELAELVALAPKVTGRSSEQEITVFKSVGFAALDLIAAEHLMQSDN